MPAWTTNLIASTCRCDKSKAASMRNCEAPEPTDPHCKMSWPADTDRRKEVQKEVQKDPPLVF